jgi:hypothetical protein
VDDPEVRLQVAYATEQFAANVALGAARVHLHVLFQVGDRAKGFVADSARGFAEVRLHVRLAVVFAGVIAPAKATNEPSVYLDGAHFEKRHRPLHAGHNKAIAGLLLSKQPARVNFWKIKTDNVSATATNQSGGGLADTLSLSQCGGVCVLRRA